MSQQNIHASADDFMSGEFWSSVGHELRNPLSTILVQAEALTSEVYGPMQENQRRAVQSIHESVTGSLEMIRDLVTLFRGPPTSASSDSLLCVPHAMIEKARDHNAAQIQFRSIELINETSEHDSVGLLEAEKVQWVITKMVGLLVLVAPSRSQLCLCVSQSPSELVVEAKVPLADVHQPSDVQEEEAASCSLLDGVRKIRPIEFALMGQILLSLNGTWKVRSSGGKVIASSVTLPLPNLHPQAPPV
jgi:hypothetical protein